MSVAGTLQTSMAVLSMSALEGEADIPPIYALMSANDPKRTFACRDQ